MKREILKRVLCAISFSFFAAFALPLHAQQYRIVDLGTLGGNWSEANAISENGIIAGWATYESGHQRAVLWDEDGIRDIGDSGGLLVLEARAINDQGQAAGTTQSDQDPILAFVWSDGSWTSLGNLPGQLDNIPTDIDSAGRIVGRSFIAGPSPPGQGYLWEDGVFTDLGTLGGFTEAYGMNELGQVVGVSSASGPSGDLGQRAFLWEGGVMTNLGVLEDRDYSQATDINDRGEVVGSSWIVTPAQFLWADRATLWRTIGTDVELVDLGLTPGPPVCTSGFPFYTDNVARAINNNGQIVGHAACVASGAPKAAFLWQDGVMHNLNDRVINGVEWDLRSAWDINDAGQIVGYGIKLPATNYIRAFLLEPVTPCAVDSDCEDRLFCNGSSVCVDGFCGDESDPCPGRECDEALDLCIGSDPCNHNGTCDPGEDCTLCPDECVSGTSAPSCGDGLCQVGLGENCTNCPEDCNGRPTGNPSKRFCCGNRDGIAPLGCSDPRCDSDGFACTGGTGGATYCCGDGSCEGDENEHNCALDCGDPNGPCLSEGSACENASDCCSQRCTGGTCRRSKK